MNANVYDGGRASDVPPRNDLRKSTPQKPKAPAKAGSAKRLVPAALLVLSAIPLAFGAFRLTQLAGGAEITPANARFFASPLPVVLHIVSASVYAILGAFQFASGFRRRRPGWHRAAGRLLVPCGLLVGLSGLWMTLFYPGANGTSELLYALRLLFGSAMVVSIVLGFTTIRRGDVMRHRAWMTRGYALGLGAGTQVLTLLAGEMIAGPPNELSRALLMGAGWVINLAVAEWAIRKRPAPPARKASAVVSHLRMTSPSLAARRTLIWPRRSRASWARLGRCHVERLPDSLGQAECLRYRSCLLHTAKWCGMAHILLPEPLSDAELELLAQARQRRTAR